MLYKSEFDKWKVTFMHHTDKIISKQVITSDGEQEFKVRYIRDESVGVITTKSDKSYFILDSADYWYDLIQEKYPPIMKCSCKNDYFNLILDYIPREDTDDFKEINITCRCTNCNKLKRLPAIKIDYSPSTWLLDNPIIFCKQPRIKYKKYSVMGYWSEKELLALQQYFSETGFFIYCWYWDSITGKRSFKEISVTELHNFLICESERYIEIYFSEEPLNDILTQAQTDEKGILIEQDLWRKRCIFLLHSPIKVVPNGMCYYIDFCSEYIDKDGHIVTKPDSFCEMIKDFRKFSKQLFKK